MGKYAKSWFSVVVGCHVGVMTLPSFMHFWAVFGSYLSFQIFQIVFSDFVLISIPRYDTQLKPVDRQISKSQLLELYIEFVNSGFEIE